MPGCNVGWLGWLAWLAWLAGLAGWLAWLAGLAGWLMGGSLTRSTLWGGRRMTGSASKALDVVSGKF
jgi:hypothetical protein